MPEITTSYLVRGRLRVRARCSETKEAEEALSSNALAVTKVPLEDFTRIRQVVSNETYLAPTAIAVTML